MEPTTSRGRRVRRLSIAAVLWILFLYIGTGIILFSPPSAHTHGLALPDHSAQRTSTYRDITLSRAVASLTNRPTIVRCWSHADWKIQARWWARRWPHLGNLGPWRAYTRSTRSPVVELSPSICIELRRLATSRRPVWGDEWPDALAYSVSVLAHEAVHASGNSDEVEAYCYGMQSISAAAVALGRTRREGRYLARRFFTHWHPRYGPPFRSRACTNNGRLDVRRNTNVWP
jgi:hypothetical protein